jgi:hypothetical protein
MMVEKNGHETMDWFLNNNDFEEVMIKIMNSSTENILEHYPAHCILIIFKSLIVVEQIKPVV